MEKQSFKKGLSTVEKNILGFIRRQEEASAKMSDICNYGMLQGLSHPITMALVQLLSKKGYLYSHTFNTDEMNYIWTIQTEVASQFAPDWGAKQ